MVDLAPEWLGGDGLDGDVGSREKGASWITGWVNESAGGFVAGWLVARFLQFTVVEHAGFLDI